MQALNVIQTKAIENQLSKGITQNDVENFLFARMNISNDAIDNIIKYSIDEDIYVFIVNMFDGRWYIFSGDYSSSPILAEGQEGGFKVGLHLSRQEKSFFESLRNHIIENKTTNYQSSSVRGNRLEWVQSLKIAKQLNLRRDNEPDTSDLDYQYCIDTLINDFYPHLTSTLWHQYAPFNNAAPWGSSTERCAVGCAVIAIAQLLYYTHYAFGFPNDIYANASCSSYYNQQPYNYVFSNPTMTTWDSMVQNWNYIDEDDPYTAALCALISYRSGTVYGWDANETYGETSSQNIPPTLASFFLTGVSLQSFTQNTIINEIQNDRPVLCEGYANADNTGGHVYLIDGYKWLLIQHSEVLTDASGNIVSQNVVGLFNDFKWGINSGGDNFFLGYITEGSYVQYNRHIHIGWSQY